MVLGLDLWVNGMHILDNAVERTIEYIEKMPKSIRKAYGQFFTSKETAVFMASLFSLPENNSELSVLDPGAGSGLLSIAIIDRIQDYPFNLVKVVCYENDPTILNLLKSNLEYAAQHSKIRIEYRIIEDNYILSQELEYNGMLGANSNPPKYDIVIGNPPYKKISKDALEARAMPDVCYGAPNLYFLFLKMAVFNLKENCEMVFIVPPTAQRGQRWLTMRPRCCRKKISRQYLFLLWWTKPTKVSCSWARTATRPLSGSATSTARARKYSLGCIIPLQKKIFTVALCSHRRRCSVMTGHPCLWALTARARLLRFT